MHQVSEVLWSQVTKYLARHYMTLAAAEAEESEMSIHSHSQIPEGKCYKDSCPSAWISSLQPTPGVPFKQEVSVPSAGTVGSLCTNWQTMEAGARMVAEQ